MTETSKLRRPRFSLLALIGLTTTIAMGIAIWLLYAEVVPLREENRRLRDELGELFVEDDTKVHVIAVRSTEDLVWKWRIWIPEGRRYNIHATGEQIPAKGFPKVQGTVNFESPGESWIEYRIRRDVKSGEWMGHVSASFAGVGAGLQDWVDWPNRVTTTDGVGASPQVLEVDRPIVIARHRVSQSGDSTKIEDPSAGFMIWLVPVP